MLGPLFILFLKNEIAWLVHDLLMKVCLNIHLSDFFVKVLH